MKTLSNVKCKLLLLKLIFRLFSFLVVSIVRGNQKRSGKLTASTEIISDNLSFQVQDFKTQNKVLIEQLQALEMQVSKLKK